MVGQPSCAGGIRSNPTVDSARIDPPSALPSAYWLTALQGKPGRAWCIAHEILLVLRPVLAFHRIPLSGRQSIEDGTGRIGWYEEKRKSQEGTHA